MRTARSLSALLLSLPLLLACGAPEEPPLAEAEASLDRAPPPATGPVLVNPAVCVGKYEPGACTCPSGFVPGPGYCVRSASPLDECNSAGDCQTVRGNPAKCHAWSCSKPYPFPDNYDACTSLPVADMTACSVSPGVPGQCFEGDCLP